MGERVGLYAKLKILSGRPDTGRRMLLALLLFGTATALPAATASASIHDREPCRVVASGKPGPRGDYVLVNRTNWFNEATLLYGDRSRIRFFVTEGIRLNKGWRGGSAEIPCGTVGVRDFDRS